MSTRLVNQVASVATLLLAILWVAILVLRFGAGSISSTYFGIYLGFGLFALVHGAIAIGANFGSRQGLLGSVLFLYEEESDLRPFTGISLVWKVFTFCLLAAVLFVVIASQGFSVYSVPNAYTWGTEVSPSLLAQHSVVENVFLGAVIPGLFEEWVVFAAIQVMVSLAMLVLKLTGWFEDVEENVAVYWMLTVVITAAAALLMAYLFAVAHERYVGNQEAILYAAGFSFTVQMMNHLGGAFLSWIPHTVHNAAVILRETLSFTASSAILVGTVLLVLGFAVYRWRAGRG